MQDLLLSTFRKVGRVCTDTRNLDPGAIFFALKGEKFNGNTFAREAIDAGCPLVVVDEDTGFTHERLVRVENGLRSLQTLARDYRRLFNIPFLAITGSNGKTTTKELVRDVLRRKYTVHATKGNFNNHIGVPLTILSMPPETTFAIIEMGANHRGEIADYCTYAEPDFGLITNIGKAHLEGFGGEEGVKLGKKELYDYVHAHDGLVFCNPELPHISEITAGMKKVEYGLHSGGQQLEVVAADPLLEFSVRLDNGFERTRVKTRLAGEYNLWNIAVAIGVGRYFGVDPDDMMDAISSYDPENNRSQLVNSGKNRIILDAYNANPSSMGYALDALAKSPASRKYFIIGDMLELGAAAEDEHRAILKRAADLGLNGLCVGPVFASLKSESPFPVFSDSQSARAYLQENGVSDALILLKGSRGIRIEEFRDIL